MCEIDTLYYSQGHGADLVLWDFCLENNLIAPSGMVAPYHVNQFQRSGTSRDSYSRADYSRLSYSFGRSWSATMNDYGWSGYSSLRMLDCRLFMSISGSYNY